MSLTLGDFGVKKGDAASLLSVFWKAKTLVVIYHDVWVREQVSSGDMMDRRHCGRHCRRCGSRRSDLGLGGVVGIRDRQGRRQASRDSLSYSGFPPRVEHCGRGSRHRRSHLAVRGYHRPVLGSSAASVGDDPARWHGRGIYDQAWQRPSQCRQTGPGNRHRNADHCGCHDRTLDALDRRSSHMGRAVVIPQVGHFRGSRLRYLCPLEWSR